MRTRMEVPQFNEVVVISDLHMGGKPGFQIFNAATEAATFISGLQSWAPDKSVALVINGDFVDFLAEEGARAFDANKAIQKLREQNQHSSVFFPVWDALRAFVRTRNRHLVITLGNHDIELAMPWVRDELLRILAGEKPPPPDTQDLQAEARGRITFAFDGAGFRCRVGTAQVLCVHGNEVDAWNMTDFLELQRMACAGVQRTEYPDWTPNGGSKFVVEVINYAKRDWPFIDLLKPEREAVFPIALALVPERAKRAIGFLQATTKVGVQALRRRLRLLGPSTSTEIDAEVPIGDYPTSLAAVVSEAFQEDLGDLTNCEAESLLDTAEDDLLRGLSPLDVLPEELQSAELAIVQPFQDAVTWLAGRVTDIIKGSADEALRLALRLWIKDTVFDLALNDTTARDLDEITGPEIDFLVVGHTHLPRALRRRNGGAYFNTGTWARLFGLERTILENPAEFQKVLAALKTKDISALDTYPGLSRQRLICAAIWEDAPNVGGRVRASGELREYEAGTTPPWKAIPDTTFSQP